jgi:putative ABC transport system permease protein
MIVHYLTTALANFHKSPFTTAANVLTLALGLACFIAAFGIATYWRSADTHHANAERTVVLGQSLRPVTLAEPQALRPDSTHTLAKYLRQDMPELERIARVFPQGEAPVTAGDRQAILNLVVAEPAFLDIFDFDFVAGDARALDTPGSVILTEEAAKRLFDDRPAVGRSLRVPDGGEVTVTGVIGPVRQPSFMGASADSVLRFDMLQDWSSHPGGPGRDEQDFWTGFSGMTFATLADGVSVDQVNARFPAFIERRMPADRRAVIETKVVAFPVSQITVRQLDNTLFGKNNLGLTTIAALLGLGLLTLAVACVNYANLAAAQAAARSREFGMRRVLGAGRAGIFAQFAVETLLLTCAGLAIALIGLAIAAAPVRAAANVGLLHFLSTGPAPWLMIAGLVLGVTLAAGAYPALVHSRARPAAVIRDRRGSSGSRTVAHVLVGIQFASASFLLIMVTVAVLQRAELQRTAIGELSDPVVSLAGLRATGVDYATLKAELERSSAIEAVTVTEWLPWSGSSNLSRFARSPEAAASALMAHERYVGFDYFEALGLDVLAGRAFDEAADVPNAGFEPTRTEPYDVVIGRDLAEGLGYAAPGAAVGQVIFVPEMPGRAARPMRVVGVVERQVQDLQAGEARGAVYLLTENAPVGGQVALVRLAGADAQAGIEHIEQVWSELAPAVPLNLRFFDDLFDQAYRQYARVGQLFILLSGVTFAIASTGLLGIAVHVAARRRHEIAVRKTLGSTTWGAVRLLLADFSKPVIVGNLIAWPLGYFAAQTYLSAFAQRIELSIWPFAASMLITLAIAWLAVGGQTFKAASVRPAQVLRDA